MRDCVYIYLARDIPAFVMYCVNGESGSSLLIDSTDSMIMYRQLNNKPRVYIVVTDFRLHHTCSIIILWLHSVSGVIRSLSLVHNRSRCNATRCDWLRARCLALRHPRGG